MHNIFSLVIGRDGANNLCLTGTSEAYPAHTTFQWFWIRVLGLPLQLWSENIMKEMGDKCGGWLATEEETTRKPPFFLFFLVLKKNHLRWARIKGKGPIENIPREVEI